MPKPRLLSLLLSCFALTGCVLEQAAEQEYAHSESDARPWEIISEHGESYLPNVFYADPIQNEQVMPTAIDGRDLIDRLIYPTIGNPNLYVKDDASDSLMVVLRVEPELLDAADLSFHLVRKAGRDSLLEADQPLVDADQANAYFLEPSEILPHAQPSDLPAVLAKRSTLRVMFRQAALAHVQPGLYDLRYELVKDGQLIDEEHQYNAVRVFEEGPSEGAYKVISVTDTQVSVGAKFRNRNQPHLRAFVSQVNEATDPNIRDAAFITFNGDLHHGGSPAGLRHKFVSQTYVNEARVIVEILRELEIPIFLTPGNHDGHSSMGHAPKVIKTFDGILGPDLRGVVMAAENKPWPGFTWDSYKAFIDEVEWQPGGRHLDLFTGAFTRHPGATSFAAGWSMIPRHERNMVMYDGFNQWRRSYGPLNFSWSFGDNVYLSLNTFDLRQHRRSGWGMYVVNYGGGISALQLEWLERELTRADDAGRDVVVLGHHDPRGGHKGRDHGYYFSQLPYRGLWSSAGPYLWGKFLSRVLCKLPDWALTAGMEEDCTHEGLQEWMRPDPELDCAESDRLDDGMCDPALLDEGLTDDGRTLQFGGVDLMATLARHPSARTFMLGHTHANSMEMLQEGDLMLQLDEHVTDHQMLAALEVSMPGRDKAWASLQGVDDPEDIDPTQVIDDTDRAYALLGEAVEQAPLALQGAARELAILRLTSNANMSWQKFLGLPMIGFTVLHVGRKQDERAYDRGQVNAITYYFNDGLHSFEQVGTVDLNRTRRFGAKDADNPVSGLFD